MQTGNSFLTNTWTNIDPAAIVVVFATVPPSIVLHRFDPVEPFAADFGPLDVTDFCQVIDILKCAQENDCYEGRGIDSILLVQETIVSSHGSEVIGGWRF